MLVGIYFSTVLWIQIRKIRNYLTLSDPDPTLFCTDPDQDPSIIQQKRKKNLDFSCLLFCGFFMTFYL